MTDDLISREEVLNAIATHFDNYGGIRKYATMLIKRIPTAQPKRGRWITVGVFQDGEPQGMDAACSVCGFAWSDVTYAPPSGMPYCPNCGAKME